MNDTTASVDVSVQAVMCEGPVQVVLLASVYALMLVFVLTHSNVKTKNNPSVSAVGFHSASEVCF